MNFAKFNLFINLLGVYRIFHYTTLVHACTFTYCDSNYNARVMECLHLSVLMAFSVERLPSESIIGNTFIADVCMEKSFLSNKQIKNECFQRACMEYRSKV